MTASPTALTIDHALVSAAAERPEDGTAIQGPVEDAVLDLLENEAPPLGGGPVLVERLDGLVARRADREDLIQARDLERLGDVRDRC